MTVFASITVQDESMTASHKWKTLLADSYTWACHKRIHLWMLYSTSWTPRRFLYSNKKKSEKSRPEVSLTRPGVHESWSPSKKVRSKKKKKPHTKTAEVQILMTMYGSPSFHSWVACVLLALASRKKIDFTKLQVPLFFYATRQQLPVPSFPITFLVNTANARVYTSAPSWSNAAALYTKTLTEMYTTQGRG